MEKPPRRDEAEESAASSSRRKQALWREALRALSLGWDLAIPIFGGVLLGNVLDRWLGTGHIFTLGLLMLGVMTSYYNLAKVIQRLRRADRLSGAKDPEKREEK